MQPVRALILPRLRDLGRVAAIAGDGVERPVRQADDLTVQTGKVRVRFFEYLGLSSLAAPKCEPSQL